MSVPAVFARFRAEIDRGLAAALDGRESPLYDMLRYHLGWIDERGNHFPNSTGKALRPTLCLLACQSLGGDYRRALPAAVAVELVHNYSLIHDDIQDGDTERRHRPTVWSVWGKAQAINAGSAMRILAGLALNNLPGRVPLSRRMRLQNLIDESCLALIEGQYLDIAYETRLDVPVRAYLDMVGKKTAALMACALESGAMLATRDEGVVAGFREAGRSLGMAFQIRDDILGVWGDERETGKPSGNDIRRKKKSLPVVYALEKARGPSKECLVSFYGNGVSGAEANVKAVLSVLDKVSARARAQALADKYRQEAAERLAGLPLTENGRRDIAELLDFLVERNF